MKKIILLILLSFISLAGFAQQLNEGFEGAPTTPDAAGVWTLPTSTGQGLGSWLVRDNRTNGIPNWRSTTGPFPAFNGGNCAFVDRENTGAGVLAEEWLITPQINVLTNSQIRFYTRQTLNGDTGTKYQVRVSNSATQGNLASYTILAEYTETELSTLTPDQLDWEEKIINLTFSGARYFAFVKVFTQPGATTSGDRWLVDDVKVLQKCDDPIAPLGATAISATGATVTWSVPTTASSQSNFEVQYGPQGFALGTGTIFSATSSSTPRQAVIPSGTLTPNTCYQFYVRSICTISNSEWVGPFNFCTTPLGSTCAAPIVVNGPLPYSDSSNTAIYGNNISASSPGATGCGTTGAFLGGSDVVYSYTPTAAGFLNIQMNPGTATNTGLFVYNSCANIGTSCIGGVGNATASIRTIPALQITAAQVGTPIYIVISSTTATATFPYTLTIQNVTCPNPVSLTASNQGISTATLGWANGTGNSGNNFQVVIQPAGGGIPGAADTITDVTGLSYNAAGLTAATAYQFWVRSDCGNGTYSIWSGPFLFNTTICNAVDQCTYSFLTQDSFGDGWNGATMQVRQNGIVVATITGPTDPDNQNVITFTVPMCNNIPFDLFWNTAGSFPGEVRISIKNSFGQTIYAMTTASAALAGTVLYSGTVDCVNPLCLPPTAVTVPTATITAHGATINWTSSGVPSTGWNIYVVPAGSAPPVQTQTPTFTVPGPATTYTFSDPAFLADTAYDVYVQSVCSVNSPSPWTTPAVTFTTVPTCPKPTNVTVTNIGDTSLTVNWTNVGAGTSWQVLVIPSPSSLPLPTTGWLDASSQTLTVNNLTAGTVYDVYVRAICPGPDVGAPTTPVTVTTALCPLANQCDYTFTVQDSFGDGWNGAVMQVRQNGIVVATLTGPTDAQNQTPIPVIVKLCTGVPFDLNWTTAGTFPGEVRVSITNGFAQTLYAMTTASANLAGTVLYTDSAADCNFPKCLPPSGLTATPSIFSAALDWTPAGNNTSWDVFIQTSPGTAPTAGTTPTYTGITPDNFTTPNNLQPSTTYEYYVRGICAVGSAGDWVGPFIFTTLPTCPKPTGLNYVTTNSNSADLVWTEVGPATSWNIVVQPSGGGAPAPGAGVTVTTLPTAAAPYNTLADWGPLQPGFYEFYVMSNCTSSDVSTWSGPMNFFIATALPVCASVEVDVPNDVIELCPGESCLDLSATFTDSGETTTYNVLPVAFAPPFPFTGGTQVSVNTDDIWSDSITLPFNFCFYGTNYPTIQVGSNGVLTFTPQTAPGNCAWNTTPGQVIPNPAFPIRNAIYGVYQDINPAVDTSPQVHNINYQILGTAPCRSFVVNYYQVGQFNCGTSVGLQTSQIVLYETSNIIEVYVQDRTVCSNWNEGLGVIGLQNAAGTVAHFPPDRNLGAWEAHNEAWRFTPAGASNVQFSWLQNGQPFSTDTNINVCVSQTTTMTAQAIYTGCGGQVTTKTKDVLLHINNIDVQPIADVIACDSYTLPALTVGSYFNQPNGVDPITNNVITQDQTVYVYAQTNTTPSCSDEEHFTVTIQHLDAPTVADASACVSYDLPALEAPFAYYSDPGGVTPLAGPITATQTVYVYGQNGPCSAQASFVVTIGELQAPIQSNLAGCTNVTLPTLPAGSTYYTATGGPNGTGTAITDLNITSSQTIFIFAQSGPCSAESQFDVTINNNLVPTFDPIVPNPCVGSTPPAFELTSLNGITGTWNPASIDTSIAGSVTYTFTPDGVIECAVPTTIIVTVDPPVVPTFLPIADICLNGTAPVLPTTSLEGVTGTWNPANIDTSVIGTVCYTFTPDGTVHCAVPTQLCVTVSSQILPVFNSIANICQGTAAPALLLTSTNGVTGTWTPDHIDTTTPGTFIFAFTPDAGQACALGTSLTVVVDPSITPLFDPIADICQNAAAPTLQTTSLNGVTGTWLPVTIDTSVAGSVTYTFTPDAGQPCALTTTVTVNVTTPVIPDFTSLITLCTGDTPPVLATTSPNGVNGTWSPATIDASAAGTFTYTFTPDLVPVQCAVSQTITVVVNPVITPDFAPVATFCSGTAAPLLAGTSPNGIAGVWSPALVDNQNSGCYVFTPNAGQCAATQTLCITVTPTLTPDFAQIPTFCAGETAPILANVSPNGIHGTWNPATVSNVHGNYSYVFTPDAGTCANSQTLEVTVNEVPSFELSQGCEQDLQYHVNVINGNFNTETVTYDWTHNSQPLANEHGSSVIANEIGSYAVTITNQGCPMTMSVNVSSISCTIQKGISPKGTAGGDGLNDYFDLDGLNVTKLEIFNRYGTKVYSKNNYSKEWYGQSDKGDELPDGTYFYVIARNGVEDVTGWIYINREQ